MLKRTLTAGLLACAALTPVAFAQSSPPSSSPSSQSSSPSSSQGQVQFIQTLESQQFRSSDFIGQSVYNQQNEVIGEIGELLLTRTGQASGVVIDVGGFLGMGEREVGVPFAALQFQPISDQMASNPSASGSATPSSSDTQGRSAAEPGSSPSSGPAAGAGSQSGQSGSAMGQGASGQSGAGASAEADSSSTLNARIVLNATRDQLQNAPELRDPNQPSSSGAAGPGSSSSPSGSGSSSPAK